MAMALPQPQSLTFDEFIAVERSSDVKHELVAGWLRLMAGGTPAHNVVATSLVGLLFSEARRQGCRIHASDTLLRVDESSGFYPDLMVVCVGQLGDAYETAPCLIVEVLSRSTHLFDRNTKLQAYTAIASVHQYLLISPDTYSIEMYTRVEDRWIQTRHELGDTINLTCPHADIPLHALFEDLLTDDASA
jgi:Uma2 family endonuclease